jgi:hypothetical protein
MNELNVQSTGKQKNEQCTKYIYAETVLSMTLRGNSRGEYAGKPRGAIWVESTQIRWFSK